MFLDLIKIFTPTAFAFFLGIALTPIATHFFYKYKMWKKRPRNLDVDSEDFKNIHKRKEKSEISVPCVGGLIIFLSVLITTLLFFVLSQIFPNELFTKLNFLSRSQTFVPLGIFILGAILGFADDLLEIKGKFNITRSSPLFTKIKIGLVTLFGLVAGYWFFFKLDMSAINVPFNGVLELGIFLIPVVIIVMLATFSGSVIDGLDGLSGGVLATIFIGLSAIAYANNQVDIAAFCGVITGATLAFLWFNIPPARFYMGEVGMMPLTVTLATIAFLIDVVLLLPIIALPLTLTSLSSSIQMVSKKVFGKKVFIVAPIHHHFEALGWPAYKVTMRFWILSVVFVIIGIIIAVIS